MIAYSRLSQKHIVPLSSISKVVTALYHRLRIYHSLGLHRDHGSGSPRSCPSAVGALNFCRQLRVPYVALPQTVRELLLTGRQLGLPARHLPGQPLAVGVPVLDKRLCIGGEAHNHCFYSHSSSRIISLIHSSGKSTDLRLAEKYSRGH